MFKWDPSPIAFKIPFIEWPVTWYGCFFAVGALLGFEVAWRAAWDAAKLPATEKGNFRQAIERFILPCAIFSLFFARLFEVFFYSWSAFYQNPSLLLQRDGGLASHGGVVGLLLGLALCKAWYGKKMPKPLQNFLFLFDVSVLFFVYCSIAIRLGNFFNQELVGIPTQLPWGILFLHPHGTSIITARHPTQLYEALAYLAVALFAHALWQQRCKKTYPHGLFGIICAMLFATARFMIEFLKEDPSQFAPLLTQIPFNMAQLLTLPFLAFAIPFLMNRLSARRQKI